MAPLQYEQLLRDRLGPNETLDGILTGPTLTAAVTSERLIIVGPAQPNGWEMKSLPWRLVKQLQQEPAPDPVTGQQLIRLEYITPAKASRHKAPAWQVRPVPVQTTWSKQSLPASWFLPFRRTGATWRRSSTPGYPRPAKGNR